MYHVVFVIKKRNLLKMLKSPILFFLNEKLLKVKNNVIKFHFDVTCYFLLQSFSPVLQHSAVPPGYSPQTRGQLNKNILFKNQNLEIKLKNFSFKTNYHLLQPQPWLCCCFRFLPVLISAPYSVSQASSKIKKLGFNLEKFNI